MATEAAPRRNDHRLIVLGIEVSAVVRLLRDRRFQQNVIVGIIVLAALSRLARENKARNIARLIAWDKKQDVRRGPTPSGG
jgi:hypothetical protein